MNTLRCPSCGKELSENADVCEHCGTSLVVDEINPFIEQISPYDDLFSDDVVPPPPPDLFSDTVKSNESNQEPEEKPGYVPEHTQDFSRQESISIPDPRQIAILAGVIIIGIILILAVFSITPPPQVNSTQPAITEAVTPVMTGAISTPEKTPVPDDTKSMETGAKYSRIDNFSDEESGFGTYSGDTFMRYYSQGEYHMVQKGEDVSDRALLGRNVRNFVAEAETRLDSGPLTGQYGLILRFSDDDYYSFGINGRGWFAVRKHLAGKVYDLIPLTETYILNKGYSSNILGVRADEDVLSFYINGKMVRAIRDNSISNGDIGFFVSRLAEEGYIKEAPVHVAFDNFKFGELPS